jgi:hypothetical protein
MKRVMKKVTKKRTTKKRVTRTSKVFTPTTARGMLDAIDKFFVSRINFREHSRLWNVLTALRGPDDGNSRLKRTTTEVIRSAAFPKTAGMKNSYNRRLAVHNLALFAPPYVKWETPIGGGHFKHHARAAARSLDLVQE